jgi:antitoxin FitA
MAQLVVRNLDEGVKQRLKDRARRHGRTMEAEARVILGIAVAADATKPPEKLGDLITALFKDVGLKDGETLEKLPVQYLRSPFDDDCR